MSQVTRINSTNTDIGLYSRRLSTGDEQTLVDDFIEYYCNQFLPKNKKNKLAVFVEPRIESGFPDIVFASYHPSIIENWSNERERLDVNDLKILSYLYNVTGATGVQIISVLGYLGRQTLTSLEKLMDAKLVTYNHNNWRALRHRDCFSLTKLVAVEAKLNDINKVIEQAHRNTWFASHSYALINTASPQNRTLETFTRYGIGLYTKDKKFIKTVESKRFPLPSSYLSLQFNEWIGREIAHEGG